MIRFGIVVFDGFDELDGIAPYEVLRNAAGAGTPFTVNLLTVGAPRVVEASHGLRIAVDSASDAIDWVVVPGGGYADRAPRGTWAEIQRGELPAWLRALRARGVGAASVCTGAMLLSAAGITAGRPAITHAVAREALRAEGAIVTDARVVDDGDLVTAGGVTSGIDLALWLTERLAGSVVAAKVTAEMEHHRTGPIHFGPRSRNNERVERDTGHVAGGFG